MKLLLTGINHRSAPVEVREKLAIEPAAMPLALHTLRDSGPFEEGLILSTCNRVEVAVVSERHVSLDRVLSFFERLRPVSRDSLAPHLYTLEDKEAVRHLFRVAASLDSMVVGEPQILGQLKSAYAAAKAQGMISRQLDPILTRAFSVAKRIRSETGIGSGAVSVSFAAVELAREIFGSLAQRRILIIGAGKMSELAARHLRRAGAERIAVTNRTRSRAEDLAGLFGGESIPYESFRAELPHVDIVITSSAAPEYLLRKEEMEQIIHARRNRPMFLIDIAVPRNIEPACNSVDNVFLYDIDDLQRVVDANRDERSKEAGRAQAIVDEEVERLFSRLRVRAAGPVITQVQARLEQIRNFELARFRSKLGPLTPQQEEALDQLTRGMMKKVAHGPISELRSLSAAEDAVVIERIRRMFAAKEEGC